MVCALLWSVYLYVSYQNDCRLGLVSASYKLGLLDFAGSIAATIVVLYGSCYGFNRIPLVSIFLSWFGRNSIIVLCFHLIEMAALPFQSVINFGLSAFGISSSMLSGGLTIVAKVLWCCFAIGCVHSSKMMSRIFAVYDRR